MQRITYGLRYCVTFAESEPYCHSILFVCLSGCLSVIRRPTAYHDWSITIHNQIWSDPCKPFWIPCLPYFRCQRENVQNFAYFQRQPFNVYSCHCERDASCHMTCCVLITPLTIVGYTIHYCWSTVVVLSTLCDCHSVVPLSEPLRHRLWRHHWRHHCSSRLLLLVTLLQCHTPVRRAVLLLRWRHLTTSLVWRHRSLLVINRS